MFPPYILLSGLCSASAVFDTGSCACEQVTSKGHVANTYVDIAEDAQKLIFSLDKFDLVEAQFGFLEITNLEKASVKTSNDVKCQS